MSYGQWRTAIGEAVLLDEVPRVLAMPAPEVARLVRSGRLPVHRFRPAGAAYPIRMVRLADLRALKRATQPLTLEALGRVLRRLVDDRQPLRRAA